LSVITNITFKKNQEESKMNTIASKVITFVLAATIVGLFTIAKVKCDRMAYAYNFYSTSKNLAPRARA
jgi:hypothetical protein